MGPVLPAVDRYSNRRKNQQTASELLRGFSSKLQEIEDTRLEDEALEKEGIVTKGLKGKAREERIKIGYNQILKGEDEKRKATENEAIIRDIETSQGKKEGSLSPYTNKPELALKVHGQKEPHKTQASQPIDKDQLKRITAIEKTEQFKNASLSKKKSMLHKGGVSKENASAVLDPYIEEEKLKEKSELRKEGQISRSHDAQKDFINDTTNRYKSYEMDTKPKLLQMRNIPDEDLIGPTAATFLEHLGVPLGALENPASELYQKLSLDLLKGLPETYGNRILKVEVDNFLKTIPSLMNSPDGRRMIASNMLKLGEMKEVYYNAMRREQKKSIDENEPLPRDFQQEVFDQVRPQMDRINNEFVKMSEIKAIPENTIPFFSPSGDIEFVPKEHAQWAQESGGRRIW